MTNHMHGQPRVTVDIAAVPNEPGWYRAAVHFRWWGIVGAGRFGSQGRELAETWVYLGSSQRPEQIAADVLHDAWLALEDRLA
jgi:hypothetical protein